MYVIRLPLYYYFKCNLIFMYGKFCRQPSKKRSQSNCLKPVVMVESMLQVLQGHTGSVLCLQYDDKVIISGSSDSTVRVWDVSTGDMVNTLIHHCEAVLHLRFSNGMMVTCSKVMYVIQLTSLPIPTFKGTINEEDDWTCFTNSNVLFFQLLRFILFKFVNYILTNSVYKLCFG